MLRLIKNKCDEEAKKKQSKGMTKKEILVARYLQSVKLRPEERNSNIFSYCCYSFSLLNCTFFLFFNHAQSPATKDFEAFPIKTN